MRNLQFDEMALYARVAELGSLSAAARERDVPVSQVSRTLSRLEKACGARLMQRSTHGLSLTDDGRTFLEYSRRALETIAELEGEFAARSGEPTGVVRVAASTVVAHYQLGFILGLKAFSDAVLGVFGNLAGAMLGGLLLGLIEALGAGYVGDFTNLCHLASWSETLAKRCETDPNVVLFGSNYQDVFAFIVLILVLVFRPQGLLGERVGDRA